MVHEDNLPLQIYIKDVASSSSAFINDEWLSREGLESEAFGPTTLSAKTRKPSSATRSLPVSFVSLTGGTLRSLPMQSSTKT